MNTYNKKTEFYIPNEETLDKAVSRTTHMAIVAHHDDIEIGTLHGVLECFKNNNKHFFGVVVTDGRGSVRGGKYEKYTDDEMMQVRRLEQKKAAYIGEYSALALLNFSSKETKDPNNDTVVEEMRKLILDAKPEILYTHNLADKHDTHIGVVTKVINALRLIPKENRPKKVYGCEVWRDLDWMNDNEKVIFDVGSSLNIAKSLIEVHDSQIDGSKAYDLAIVGRRIANATFSQSHALDSYDGVAIGMDLTPLILDDSLDMVKYTTDYIARFQDDVKSRIEKHLK